MEGIVLLFFYLDNRFQLVKLTDLHPGKSGFSIFYPVTIHL